MRMRQYLINNAMTSDGGERRSSLRTKHDYICLLGLALIEELFCWVSWNHNRLRGDYFPQFYRNKRKHVAFYVVDSSTGKDLGALLRADDMMQDEASIVLVCQLGRKAGHHGTTLKKTQGAKNGPSGEVAKGSVDNIGAHDKHG